MRKLTKACCVLAALVTSMVLTATSQATPVTYSYIGPDFDHPLPLPAPYSAGDHVESFVTIDDAALDATGTGHIYTDHLFPNPDFLAFGFSDGVKTLGLASPVHQYSLNLAFRSFELIAWDISFVSTPPLPILAIGSRCGYPDFALLDEVWWCGGDWELYDFAYDSPDTVSSVQVRVVSVLNPLNLDRWQQVPEPATFLLLGAGFAGLSLVTWRRDRRK